MALPSEVPPAQWTAEQVQLFLREQGLGDNLLAQFASISGKGEAYGGAGHPSAGLVEAERRQMCDQGASK